MEQQKNLINSKKNFNFQQTMSAHPTSTDIEIKSTNRKKMRKCFSLKQKQHSHKCREKVQKKIPSQGEFSNGGHQSGEKKKNLENNSKKFPE